MSFEKSIWVLLFTDVAMSLTGLGYRAYGFRGLGLQGLYELGQGFLFGVSRCHIFVM